MRALAVALLAIVMSACAAPPTAAPPTAAPTTAAPTAAPPTSAIRSGTPSAGDALFALLPTTLDGVATTKTSLSPAGRNTPRVFLKVIARLGKKPPDALLALAFSPGATVYAMRVAGTSGSQIAQAFFVERTGIAPGSSAPPALSIGGKQVTRLGLLAGTFLYASGDTFFFVECPDEPAAAEVLKLLP